MESTSDDVESSTYNMEVEDIVDSEVKSITGIFCFRIYELYVKLKLTLS